MRHVGGYPTVHPGKESRSNSSVLCPLGTNSQAERKQLGHLDPGLKTLVTKSERYLFRGPYRRESLKPPTPSHPSWIEDLRRQSLEKYIREESCVVLNRTKEPWMDGGKRSRERNSPSYIVGLRRPARPTGPWLQRELGNSHAKIMKKNWVSVAEQPVSPWYW